VPRPAKKPAPTPPSSFELLAYRIQRQILSPKAQLERRVVIARSASELEDDWSQLLEQLSEEESLTIAKLEDGSVLLTWPPSISD